MTENNSGDFAVLFVDDEEKALKYFSKALAGRFPVYTAKDVDSAEELLESKSNEIAIVISDQRMPGRNGVELLKKVRQEYPAMVRLLTTAYSDLNDAIEAINRGEIYRYIQKPWHVESLQAEMVGAMHYFHLRRERDLLLAEKLATRQRMSGIQRLAQLIVYAQTADHLRNADYALRDFLDLLHTLPGVWESDGMGNVDQWDLTRWETRRISDFIDALKRDLAVQSVPVNGAGLGAEQLLALNNQVAAELNCEVSMGGSNGAPALNCESSTAALLVRSVLGVAANLNEVVQPVALEILSASAPYSGGEGVELRYGIRGRWPEDRHFVSGSALTAVHPVYHKLFAASLMAAHHGGKLNLVQGGGEIRLNVSLPRSAVVNPELDGDWLTESLSNYEPSVDDFYPDL